ncbi:MAG TPA: phosphotransferase [Acidimicrobiales bacterium]|nr:phosphotransferase [Acidimicrobiales bacterium]
MKRDPCPDARSAYVPCDMLRDAALPAAAALLDEEASSMLSTAVAAMGGELLEHRPYQTSYRPGKRLAVHYDCRVGLVGGEVTRWTLVAVAASAEPPPGALVLEQGSARVALWRFPYDPFLPGLASVVDPIRVRELLDDFAAAPGDPTLTVRSYRAGRRAVVEARVAEQRLFLKVVRPSAAANLHRLHTTFSKSLPVPPSLGWSDLGIIALGALPGRTLSQQLEQLEAPLPSADAILDLCDRISAVALDSSRTASVHDAVAHHVRTLSALRPELEERLVRLAEAICAVSSEQLVTVHGDLHPGQLLTNDAVTGLLDLDRVARGSTADDYAMLLGHLRVHTTLLERPMRGRAERFTAQVRAACLERAEPADLTLREAAVILGLATAPFRVLQPGWQAATDERVALSEALASKAIC